MLLIKVSLVTWANTIFFSHIQWAYPVSQAICIQTKYGREFTNNLRHLISVDNLDNILQKPFFCNGDFLRFTLSGRIICIFYFLLQTARIRDKSIFTWFRNYVLELKKSKILHLICLTYRFQKWKNIKTVRIALVTFLRSIQKVNLCESATICCQY